MYLSRELLAICQAHILQTRNTDRARREWVSGISRFLACASLLNERGQVSVSLRPEAEGRRALPGRVAEVLRLDADGEYTGDFRHIDRSPDYNINSHFLTTGVKDSRGRQGVSNPGRPAPLLLLTDEEVTLHPDFEANLRAQYGVPAVQNALALWLTRAQDHPDAPEALVAAVNADLATRYGAVVARQFALDLAGYQAIVAELAEGALPLVEERPAIAGLFADMGAAGAEGEPVAEVGGAVVAGLGANLILYGAPGTGKSHRLEQGTDPDRTIRTVFHPDLQNSDFFGCLKPRSVGGVTHYAFTPGPFARAVLAALAEPDHPWFLVIEEINRAPAAAVFGEIFQLLDRNDLGRSSYEIDFPTPESAEWFVDQGQPIPRLYIPANLSLRASMNSADQGVYPLDTAFRRRWEQDYMPLDYAAGPKGALAVSFAQGDVRQVAWQVFVRVLNQRLTARLSIAEDRLLGQWFVKARELGGRVPGKILLYLWDDLLRHEGREVIFDLPRLITFGDVSAAVQKEGPIFAPDFLAELRAAIAPIGQGEAPDGADAGA